MKWSIYYRNIVNKNDFFFDYKKKWIDLCFCCKNYTNGISFILVNKNNCLYLTDGFGTDDSQIIFKSNKPIEIKKIVYMDCKNTDIILKSHNLILKISVSKKNYTIKKIPYIYKMQSNLLVQTKIYSDLSIIV